MSQCDLPQTKNPVNRILFLFQKVLGSCKRNRSGRVQPKCIKFYKKTGRKDHSLSIFYNFADAIL